MAPIQAASDAAVRQAHGPELSRGVVREPHHPAPRRRAATCTILDDLLPLLRSPQKISNGP